MSYLTPPLGVNSRSGWGGGEGNADPYRVASLACAILALPLSQRVIHLNLTESSNRKHNESYYYDTDSIIPKVICCQFEFTVILNNPLQIQMPRTVLAAQIKNNGVWHFYLLKSFHIIPQGAKKLMKSKIKITCLNKALK